VDLHLVTVKQLKILHKAMMMMMMTIHWWTRVQCVKAALYCKLLSEKLLGHKNASNKLWTITQECDFLLCNKTGNHNLKPTCNGKQWCPTHVQFNLILLHVIYKNISNKWMWTTILIHFQKEFVPHQDTICIPKNLNNALLLLDHSPAYSSSNVRTGKNCVSETH
jgi:hypothetical protein